jgi:prepilin-type N-terminal cleavage/methylation domain-containing protein
MASQPDKSCRPNAGMTLVELVVALSIGSILVSLVLFSWTFMARHTVLQKRKSMFYAQTELAASMVAGDVRRSSQVIAFDAGSITFVRTGGDTVTYRLRNDSLVKNDTALRFASDGARVVRFAVEREDAPSSVQTQTGADSSCNASLIITLGAVAASGIASEIRNRVKTRYLPDTLRSGIRWNY